MNGAKTKNNRARLSVVFAALFLYSTPAPAQTLTITVEQAVERALQHNPDLLISRATVDELSARAWQATTTRLPRLDLTGNVTRFDRNLFGSESFVVIEERRNAQLRATHSVFSGGQTHGRARVARSLAEAAKYDHTAARLLTRQLVRQSFYDAQLAERLLEVANEAIEINKEELRRTRVRFEIGEAAKINLLRAEVQLSNSIPEALRAKHNFRLAKTQLANLIAFDLDPNDLDVVSLELSGDLKSSSRLTLPALGRVIQAAHDNRPELRAARAQVNVARGEAQTSWSSVLPRVDAYGAYNWQIVDGEFSGQPFKSDNKGWEIGATASLPIFDFLGNYQSVRAGRAKIRQAEFAEEDLRRQIDLDVRTAYSAYLESVESVTSQEKNVERAHESLRLSRQLQSAGEATQLEVQKSQLDLTQASSLSAGANRDLLLAETALLTAMGLATLEDAARYGVVVIQ